MAAGVLPIAGVRHRTKVQSVIGTIIGRDHLLAGKGLFRCGCWWWRLPLTFGGTVLARCR